MTPEEIKAMIEAGIEGAQAQVDGDGHHFQARIVAPAFEGLNMVRQHQLVYEALGNAFQDNLHALSIKTYTPAQWDQAGGLQVL